MRWIIECAAVCVAIVFCAQLAPAQKGRDAVIDTYISRQATREQGEEYTEARKVVRGDVNGDRKDDLVVLYTIEGFDGGNSYRQYIAVFLGRGNGFNFADYKVVGGKLYRGVELRSVTGRQILLDTMEYKKNDPACCPSRKGKTRYLFTGGKLKEAKIK